MAYNEHFKGEDVSVTKFYGDRTVLTSCAYLLQYIKPDMTILDVGCGPGTITAGLSKIVPDGKVTGVDVTSPIIERARSTFPLPEFPNLTFAVGDAMKLSDFKDNSFDVVHAHQVLIHLTEPITALQEFYRICKPGRIVACREGNGRRILSLKPDLPAIRQYWDNTVALIDRNGGHIDAGGHLEEWAQKVGFQDNGGKIVLNMGELRFPSHLEGMKGESAEQAIRAGIATRDQMDIWREAWEEFDRTKNNEFVFETGEILCWKGLP
ncbi:UbiE family methyltransferase [Mollisia scopiformis]|uniref:UbiE family methyltransferase n=1 Tax=Mollisia scopiformis TaxID=149040 RepID=A0A194X4S6_MOLSC|nr:UbiE family methyltransferase [Mollisia scopiformis]KUJ15069.1 UbiE family methyltransferase [Mollisia scopiformis]